MIFNDGISLSLSKCVQICPLKYCTFHDVVHIHLPQMARDILIWYNVSELPSHESTTSTVITIFYESAKTILVMISIMMEKKRFMIQ